MRDKATQKRPTSRRVNGVSFVADETNRSTIITANCGHARHALGFYLRMTQPAQLLKAKTTSHRIYPVSIRFLIIYDSRPSPDTIIGHLAPAAGTFPLPRTLGSGKGRYGRQMSATVIFGGQVSPERGKCPARVTHKRRYDFISKNRVK